MSERVKLGVFDVDGTIRTKEGVPQEVVEGIAHLWKSGVTTTVMTGRGYARLREALAASYNQTISASSNTPIGLENGGRIAERNGLANLKYYPLSVAEIQDIILTITRNPDEVKLLAYYPEDIRRRTVIWTPNSGQAAALKEKFGHFADIFSTSAQELDRMMRLERPCMVAVQPQDLDFAGEFPRGLNLVRNEQSININMAEAGKGVGTQDIADILDVPVSQILVAGNEENDIPLYEIGAGTKVWVGEQVSGIVTFPDVIQVASSRKLGEYLKTL